jgi:hypothetical protein
MGRLTIGALACAMLAALLVGAAVAAPGHNRKVSPSGSDTGNCAKAACRTIGYAAGQANAGDRIDVAAGTYHETVAVTRRLDLNGHKSVIAASGLDNGITVVGADAAGTKIHGFTIVNAGLEGIFANRTSKLKIDHNELAFNDASGIFSPQCVNQPDDCGEALHLQSVTDSKLDHNNVHDNVGGILLTDEDGPTAHNTIDHNVVLDNPEDCGITLASHWFSFAGPATPDVSGVYENKVTHNTSNHNGAAGIGVFAGPPGGAAWGNVVEHNTAMNNGLPGVAIHSHFGLQNAEANRIVDNRLSGNGADDDAETGAGAGIVVFADLVFHDPPGFPPATAIQKTTVERNHISNEHFGIFTLGAVAPEGLNTNKFDKSVDVPVSIN